MATCCDEHFVPEIVPDELTFPHRHLGEMGSIKLMIDLIYIIGSVTRVNIR